MIGKRLTTEEFIERSNVIHNYKYDYRLVNYKNNYTKVTIICKTHGEFEQDPKGHLASRGCRNCGNIKGSKNQTKNVIQKKFKDLVQPDDYKLIPLTKGKFAKVDNDDFDKLKCINWKLLKSGYPRNNNIGLMHRVITNCPENMVIDHINHDTLDNRKSNLRVCTQHENSMNQSAQIGFTSKYKGVCWYKRDSIWTSQIHFKRKKIHLGRFASEIEAAKSYDRKARELFGEFALTNF